MGWIGIFNRTTTDREITLNKRDLGLIQYKVSYNLTSASQSFLLEDVWSDKSLDFAFPQGMYFHISA